MILIVSFVILLVKVEVERAAFKFSKLGQSGEFFFLLLYCVVLGGLG